MRRLSRWPARLDRWQSLSGLLLGLFIWVHLAGDASILLGQDAFAAVSHFWEGGAFFGRPVPALTAWAAGGIFLLLLIHAALALRKFPGDVRAYRAMQSHSRTMRHGDTRLWLVQVWTGFAMFFLAPVHLYVVMAMPDEIGPIASPQRITWDGFWPLYLLLLFAVIPHAAIGLYRLAVKWDWPRSRQPEVIRRRLRLAMWFTMVFFIVLSTFALARFYSIGLQYPPEDATHSRSGSNSEQIATT